MKTLGNILQIYSANKESKSKQRPIVSALNMIKGHGIKNDKFALKNEDRAVMLIGKKAYDIASLNNISLEEGNLGENILVDFDPHLFVVGDIFSINEVLLEVTQCCTICKSLCNYDARLPKLLSYDRGLYCKILSDGIITKNHKVYLKG